MILVVVLAAAAVALDLWARSAAESAAARQVRHSTGATGAGVTFHSEPFLWDTLVNGKVNQVTVTADDVPLGPLQVTRVKVQGWGVAFDRGQLFNSRKVRLTSVARATVTITTHLTQLGAQAIRALDFTRIPLVPDCHLALQAISGGYDLSCTVSPVPASMLNAINNAA